MFMSLFGSILGRFSLDKGGQSWKSSFSECESERVSDLLFSMVTVNAHWAEGKVSSEVVRLAVNVQLSMSENKSCSLSILKQSLYVCVCVLFHRCENSLAVMVSSTYVKGKLQYSGVQSSRAVLNKFYTNVTIVLYTQYNIRKVQRYELTDTAQALCPYVVFLR